MLPKLHNVVNHLQKDMKKAMTDRLQKRFEELEEPHILNYCNADVYNDESEMEARLTLLQHLTQDELIEFCGKHANLFVVQMMQPLFGRVEIPRCLEDDSLSHFLIFLASKHITNGWEKIVERNSLRQYMVSTDSPPPPALSEPLTISQQP